MADFPFTFRLAALISVPPRTFVSWVIRLIASARPALTETRPALADRLSTVWSTVVSVTTETFFP